VPAPTIAVVERAALFGSHPKPSFSEKSQFSGCFVGSPAPIQQIPGLSAAWPVVIGEH
jgi:hypothetical protein